MSRLAEHEVYRDGRRRVVILQRTEFEVVRSEGYSQLIARLVPVAVTVEDASSSETIDLTDRQPTRSS